MQASANYSGKSREANLQHVIIKASDSESIVGVQDVERFLKGAPVGGPPEFTLQRVALKIGNKTESFLLERLTGLLYQPAGPGHWPRLAGVLRVRSQFKAVLAD
eukprot:scaffold166896_cov28-Prasinocladus_malaysianus.AAC.5